jgi:hypothetical protein
MTPQDDIAGTDDDRVKRANNGVCLVVYVFELIELS